MKLPQLPLAGTPPLKSMAAGEHGVGQASRLSLNSPGPELETGATPVLRPWSSVARRTSSAFTMVEIAISLAVIAFALVAIIGVLPHGLSVQRENREETIINQDASVFLSAIRNGEWGLDSLTNYVMGITVTTVQYNSRTQLVRPVVTWSYATRSNAPAFTLTNLSPLQLTNGRSIVGLLSTPKYRPGIVAGNFEINQVVAYVRAFSGIATEKPPQANADVQADAFAYRLICENQQVPMHYVDPPPPPAVAPNYTMQLTNNLRELRLTFRWPLNHKGQSGKGRQTFRAQVAGFPEREVNGYPRDLYFFRPTTFVKALP
jgi:type II secretory pathway pseudopilin PulG